MAFLADGCSNVTVAQAPSHTLGGYLRVRPLTLKHELTGSSHCQCVASLSGMKTLPM